jgi:polar amino acid transport system substrate-binding protein
MRKIVVTVVLAVVMAGCAPQAAKTPETATLRFGIDRTPFPPFYTEDSSGHWSGFEVDLMEAVCAEMRARCEIVATPWNSMIAALEAGTIDVIWSSMTATRERAAVIDFSDPYYDTHAVLLTAGSSALDPSRPATLAGKRIGVIGETPHEAYLRAHFPDALVLPAADLDANHAALAEGRVDAVFEDQFLADLFLKSAQGGTYAVKWSAPFDPAINTPVAAGLRKGDSRLKERLNAALAAVRKSGRFQEINARTFDFSIAPE